MKTNLAIAAALATIMTTGVLDTAEAADKADKEKCYGVSAAGQNDCANLAGTHSRQRYWRMAFSTRRHLHRAWRFC
jgi:uncharacterized membrane protein